MTTIIGTPGDDDLSSANAGDVIQGLGGNDVLAANAANITLDGGDGDDQLFSFVGNSTLIGGSGGDLLLGSSINDTASYASDPAGVTVNLVTGEASDGYGGTDTLFGIANVAGSAFNDSLTGDGSANVLAGGAGNDTLAGGGGADVFRYSFTLSQGGGESETFTDFIGQNGDALTDNFYTQGFFASQYSAWLNHLVDTFGLGSDVDGDGIVKVGLNQNDGTPDATPFIEGESAEDLSAMFTDRDSVLIKTGKVTQERFYSNTFTTGDGEDTAASADGFDTIVDFTFGPGGDKLEFDGLAGLTLDQFTTLFTASQVDANGDGTTDTVLALADGTWSATLLDVSGHTIDEFYSSSIFS